MFQLYGILAPVLSIATVVKRFVLFSVSFVFVYLCSSAGFVTGIHTVEPAH